MSQLETQRDELEEDGREIEEALRDMKDSNIIFHMYSCLWLYWNNLVDVCAAAEEDELMEQWLNLINERSGLEKRVAELTLKLVDKFAILVQDPNMSAQISVYYVLCMTSPWQHILSMHKMAYQTHPITHDHDYILLSTVLHSLH